MSEGSHEEFECFPFVCTLLLHLYRRLYPRTRWEQPWKRFSDQPLEVCVRQLQICRSPAPFSSYLPSASPSYFSISPSIRTKHKQEHPPRRKRNTGGEVKWIVRMKYANSPWSKISWCNEDWFISWICLSLKNFSPLSFSLPLSHSYRFSARVGEKTWKLNEKVLGSKGNRWFEEQELRGKNDYAESLLGSVGPLLSQIGKKKYHSKMSQEESLCQVWRKGM